MPLDFVQERGHSQTRQPLAHILKQKRVCVSRNATHYGANGAAQMQRYGFTYLALARRAQARTAERNFMRRTQATHNQNGVR